jgi:hypothetical protein
MGKKKSAAKIKTKPKKDDSLVRVIKVEIAKPLDRSWDEFGADLRGLRNVAHRCMQGAMLNLTRYDSNSVEKPTNENSGNSYSMQTLAYHGAKDALASYNVWAKKKKLSEVTVPGGTISAWSTEAYNRWRAWKGDGCRDRLPSWGHGSATMIRKQELSFGVDSSGGLLAKLNIGGKSERVAIRPGRGGQWPVVKSICSGETESLDGKIVYNERARRKDGSKGKWMLAIAYRRPPKALPAKGPWLVVHRGSRNLFTLLSSGGQPWKRIPGRSLLHQKQCLKARMSDIRTSQSAGELGKGARGHGKKRRFAAYSKLEDTLDRLVTTRMRQMAARVVELAKMWRCQGVIVEDYDGIKQNTLPDGVRRFVWVLPLAKAKDAIVAAAENAGLRVIECPSLHISTKCPACETIDPRNHNHRTGVFHCQNLDCHFERDADWVAAYWMLQAGLPPGENNEVLAKFRNELMIQRALKEAKQKAA